MFQSFNDFMLSNKFGALVFGILTHVRLGADPASNVRGVDFSNI